jgi:beta-glucosidase
LKQPFRLSFKKKAPEGYSDLGWENYSRGLLKICQWLTATGKPLIITENGIAAEDDQKRSHYMSAMLRMVQKTLKMNYPLRGYFHWSLIDNYEWLEGFSARFGLVHVDFEDNHRRRLKESARFYADFIENFNFTNQS